MPKKQQPLTKREYTREELFMAGVFLREVAIYQLTHTKRTVSPAEQPETPLRNNSSNDETPKKGR